MCNVLRVGKRKGEVISTKDTQNRLQRAVVKWTFKVSVALDAQEDTKEQGKPSFGADDCWTVTHKLPSFAGLPSWCVYGTSKTVISLQGYKLQKSHTLGVWFYI